MAETINLNETNISFHPKCQFTRQRKDSHVIVLLKFTTLFWMKC